jgi:hypothetical protein
MTAPMCSWWIAGVLEIDWTFLSPGVQASEDVEPFHRSLQCRRLSGRRYLLPILVAARGAPHLSSRRRGGQWRSLQMMEKLLMKLLDVNRPCALWRRCAASSTAMAAPSRPWNLPACAMRRWTIGRVPLALAGPWAAHCLEARLWWTMRQFMILSIALRTERAMQRMARLLVRPLLAPLMDGSSAL